MTTKDVMERYGVTMEMVKHGITSGTLRVASRGPGNRAEITVEDAERWMEHRKRAAAKPPLRVAPAIVRQEQRRREAPPIEVEDTEAMDAAVADGKRRFDDGEFDARGFWVTAVEGGYAAVPVGAACAPIALHFRRNGYWQASKFNAGGVIVADIAS